MRTFGLLALSLAVQACGAIPSLDCRPSEQAAVMDTLYFGTAKPTGPVTSADWTGFIERVVTPRFPQGLTTWDAAGQWQTADGAVQRESAHLLQLVHPDTPEAERAVTEVMQRYKTEFQQEAVLRVRSAACVSW